MKKLLFILLMTVPFAVTAQDPQVDPCGVGGCTDTLSYTIKNDQGSVVDHTVYDRHVGVPYTEAMVLKYVRLLRCIGKETSTFVDVLKLVEGGQAPAQALQELLEQEVQQ